MSAFLPSNEVNCLIKESKTRKHSSAYILYWLLVKRLTLNPYHTRLHHYYLKLQQQEFTITDIYFQIHSIQELKQFKQHWAVVYDKQKLATKYSINKGIPLYGGSYCTWWGMHSQNHRQHRSRRSPPIMRMGFGKTC